MSTDPRQDAWAARKAEQANLTELQRQRRYVYGTYGHDMLDAGARALRLDEDIRDSIDAIADYTEQCCTRPVRINA